MGKNNYGDLNRWIDIAMDKKMWDYKIAKLKNPGLDIPEPEPQSQSQNSNNNGNQDMAPSPPRQRRSRNNNPPPSANPNSEILEAYQTLSLEHNATSREVKIKFRQLSRIYHPDKHNPTNTGMSNVEAQEFFQKINNAQELLTNFLQTNHPPNAQ